MLDRLEAGFEADGFGFWAVEERGSGALLGMAGLNRVSFKAPFTTSTVESSARAARRPT